MCSSCDAFSFLGSIFGYLVQLFYIVFKNYGVAIIFFTIATRLMMFPLTIKQQKSTTAQQRLQPKLNELKQKFGNNKQAYNEAVQELYQKEGVSMSGGCLPMLIQFPLFFGMYAAIRQPLSNVLHVSTDLINKVCELLGIVTGSTNYYYEIDLVNRFRDNNFSVNALQQVPAAIDAGNALTGVTNLMGSAMNSIVPDTVTKSVMMPQDMTAQVTNILGEGNFNEIADMSDRFGFLGIDLLQTASFSPANAALILAFIVVIVQIGSMLLTNKMNKMPKTTQGCNPNLMGIMFGGMSFFFALSTPAAFPLYWTTSSLLGPAQTWITREFFGPITMGAKAEAQRNARLKISEDKRIKEVNEAKGAITLGPCMPTQDATVELTQDTVRLQNQNKNKGGKNNKNKGGNNGGYVGKKK